MTTDSFIFFSGLAFIVGGSAATIGWVYFAFFDPTRTHSQGKAWIAFNFLVIFGGLFVTLGLPGFYLRISEQIGVISFIGLTIMFVGMVIPYVAVQSVETTTAPNIPARMRLLVTIGAPSLMIGLLITSGIILASGLYPVWIPIGLIISVLLGVLSRVTAIPRVLSHGIFPGIYTAILALLGIYSL